jgi:hypothetical protein
MQLDDYLTIFRQEYASLNWQERQQIEAVFATRYGPKIFMALDELLQTGKLTSEHFQKSLQDFYWECI